MVCENHMYKLYCFSSTHGSVSFSLRIKRYDSANDQSTKIYKGKKGTKKKRKRKENTTVLTE